MAEHIRARKFNERATWVFGSVEAVPGTNCMKNSVEKMDRQDLAASFCQTVNFYQAEPNQNTIVSLLLPFLHHDCVNHWSA